MFFSVKVLFCLSMHSKLFSSSFTGSVKLLFGIWLKFPQRDFLLKLKTRHMYFMCAWCLYVNIAVLDINLDSFFPCNQLTATSYIYQSLGDVEWYVRWSSRHDNHETRGSLSSPQAHPTPSCGRLPWSEPPRGTGNGDDRLAEGPWPVGHLEDSCGSILSFGYLSLILRTVG